MNKHSLSKLRHNHLIPTAKKIQQHTTNTSDAQEVIVYDTVEKQKKELSSCRTVLSRY